MNSVFEWTRRRRISAFSCSKSVVVKKAEFFNFVCNCNAQETPTRQPVIEIVVAEEITCILQSDGIGKALDRSTHKEICQLNATPYCCKSKTFKKIR